jgi:hypothetical protein
VNVKEKKKNYKKKKTVQLCIEWVCACKMRVVDERNYFFSVCWPILFKKKFISYFNNNSNIVELRDWDDEIIF